MNSCNTDIFFGNYYYLQSVRFEYKLYIYIGSNIYFNGSKLSNYLLKDFSIVQSIFNNYSSSPNGLSQ